MEPRVLSMKRSLLSSIPWVIFALLLHIIIVKFIALKFPPPNNRPSLEITFLGAILEPLEPSKSRVQGPLAKEGSPEVLPTETGRYEAFRSDQKPRLAPLVKGSSKSTQKIPLTAVPVAAPSQKGMPERDPVLEKKDLKYNRLKLPNP